MSEVARLLKEAGPNRLSERSVGSDGGDFLETLGL